MKTKKKDFLIFSPLKLSNYFKNEKTMVFEVYKFLKKKIITG
jgi:hypothetical protein